MATSISASEIYAPVFFVELAKNKAKLPIESIASVEVDENLEAPGIFTLSFNETFDINKQSFRWLDDERIATGTEVVIHFGYAMKPGKQSLIRGKIRALSPSFLTTGIPTLSVEGYDLSHDLHKTLKKFNAIKVTYAQVAKDIATANGLDSGGIETTQIVHPKVERKRNEYDHALMKRLAAEIGFEFFVRDKTLYFRAPKDDQAGSITFEFRKNFISFVPRMATSPTVNEVRVTAWDVQNKEPISETARVSDIRSSVGIADFDNIVEKSQGQTVTVKLEGHVVHSKEEAKKLAVAELKRRNKGFIEGTLECAGNPQLRPGITVNIEKLGARFSGVYYVTRAKHSLGDGGYRTSIEVRRSM